MPDTSKTLKAILDNLPENFVLISPEHKVISFNKATNTTLYSLFGKSLHIGADYRDFVTAENKTTYLDSFQKAINGEHIISHIQVKNENNYIWYEFEMFPNYDDDHQLFGVTLRSKDVDTEKKTELEFEKISERVNAVFENTTESILLIDKDYTVLNFNKAAEDRLYKNAHKHIFIGEDFRDFLYTGSEHTFFTMFEKAVSGQIAESEVETRDINGLPLWFHTKMSPTYKKNGELLGVSIVTNHITERKLTELALRESEKKFKKIVESAPMPIIIVDDQTNIILANPETENVFGYSVEELLNENIQLLIPKRFQKQHKKEERNYFQNPVTVKHNINRYVPAIKKNGEEIMIEASLSHYQLNNKTYIIAIILDVTQRIQNEQQIEAQLKKLQSIAWQQSHEIRRPLSNILGAYDLIQLETTQEEKQKHMDSLYLSAKELDNIIHQIVDHTT